MPRDAVLGAVRAALAGVEPMALSHIPAPAPAGIRDGFATLAARFAAAARAVGTIVHEVDDLAGAVVALRGVLEEAAAARVVVAPSPLARAVTSEAIAALADVAVQIVDAATPVDVIAAADVGITEADVLVAASGTIVVRAAGCARSVSLLPATHVAIVPRTRLVAELGGALATVDAARSRPDACVTLITGPSRTADIEKKLVVGVHGPCALHVLVIRDAEG